MNWIEAEKKILELTKKYPEKESALLPALHIAQEIDRWLPTEAIEKVADLVGVSAVRAYSVANFYTMFRKKPVGKYFIEVCRNISCSLLGAESLIEFLEKELEIKCGETTLDNKYTLQTAECLGSCGTAPVMLINNVLYESLDDNKIKKILEELN